MSIKKLNPKFIDKINSITDLPDTPSTITDDKFIKVTSDGTGIEFDGDSSTLNDEIVDTEEYSLDYITGFDMESHSPDVNGWHEKIRINKGFVEIAEPGDLSTNNFWNSSSKMVANYPLRNGQTRDISGHKNNSYALFHRRYPFDSPNAVYWKRDGDSLHYRTEYGVANDFLTSSLYYRDEYPILDSGKVSVSCWVKYLENVIDFRYIFTDYFKNNTYDYRIFSFGQNGMNELRIYIYDGDSNTRQARYDVNLTSNLQIGQWYHFYFQFDSTDLANTLEIYIDNVLQTHSLWSDNRVNTELAYSINSWITVGGLFYLNGNYINTSMNRSVTYFNRLLTSTERDYIHNNVYVTRGLNSTPTSDIYELPSDVDIDTENLTSSDFLDDTYTATLENRWYYVYVQPSITSGECEVKISARPPIRNRFNVESEGYRKESLYHPYLNARCIGVFQYGRVSTTDTSGKKVIKFKQVDGYYQFGYTTQYTRPNNSWSTWPNSNVKNLPCNINSLVVRVYYNAHIVLSGGLNMYRNNQRQLQRPDATNKTIFFKVHTYEIMNMGSNIYWRQWDNESTDRVYMQFYGFYFTR